MKLVPCAPFCGQLFKRDMTASYGRCISPDIFPRADFYAGLGRAGARQVGERETRARRFPWSERHLQCVWFDPELRPAGLKTGSGEDILVEDPGVWNSEAGPDFLGAAIRIGPGRRRIAADVEIHLHPADWERHGHASDPRYAKVRIHVTYFPGTLPDGHLPPGSVQIALKDALAANPLFSFENIDVTTYPQFARATPTPCSQILAAWTPDERRGPAPIRRRGAPPPQGRTVRRGDPGKRSRPGSLRGGPLRARLQAEQGAVPPPRRTRAAGVAARGSARRPQNRVRPADGRRRTSAETAEGELGR